MPSLQQQLPTNVKYIVNAQQLVGLKDGDNIVYKSPRNNPEWFDLAEVSICEDCGAVCVINAVGVNHPGITFRMRNAETIERPEIWWNDNFGGSLCDTCDSNNKE